MIKCSLVGTTNQTAWCCVWELCVMALLSPCTPLAWAAAVASVQHFGCSCWYRYVKLDSLCLGGHMNVYTVCSWVFWGVGDYVSRKDK